MRVRDFVVKKILQEKLLWVGVDILSHAGPLRLFPVSGREKSYSSCSIVILMPYLTV